MKREHPIKAAFAIALSAAVSMFIAVPGCASDPREGYAFSSGHDDQVKTIAIEVFDNQTFSTGVEAQLTEAIAREVMRSTKWRVSSIRVAETVLTGKIVSSELRPLSSDQQTGLVQELGVRLTVDFDWVDNRTGKTLVARRSFTAMDTFVPAIRTGERLETGQYSTIDGLAKDIVAELRSSW
ncbi:MAG: hypothetical protein AMXMBFR58_03630 [Phycisphaerae bacterium]|nr:hypothetical protein [Phycisphaerales bacterium]